MKIEKFLVIFLLIALFFIFFVPIQLISTQLSSYAVIEESHSFIHGSSTAPTERLIIDADVGNIEIQYTYLPVNYDIRVEVIFDMRSANVRGKDYSYYFDLKWQSINSTANITLKISSELWFDDSIWIRKNVDIVVSIKADVIVDIFTNLGEGDYKLTVPWSTSIRNLSTNVISGNIFYNFEYCLIRGNISTTSKIGDLYFNSYDVEHVQNNNWDINLEDGNFYVDIYQNTEIRANITGKALISGDVHLDYQDDMVEVGAIFSFPLSDWELGIGQVRDGFEVHLFPVLPDVGFLLKSNDYPANSNYYLTFNITDFHFINVMSL